MHFTSNAAVGVVAADWNSHMGGAWTSGASALDLIFPVGTTLDETLVASLQVVSFAGPPPVDKLREVLSSSPTISDPGTSANPALPDQNAILVSLRAAGNSREDRGRIHLPAPDQTLVTLNEISSTVAGHVSTAIDGVRTNMAANGHTMVLATYKLTKTGTAVGSTRPVVKVETDRIIRTVRMRNKRERAIYV
jgi:hypothetical protein